MQFQSRNPYSNELMLTINYLSNSELEQKLGNTVLAKKYWQHTTLQHRIACVSKLAELINKRYEELGRLSCLEMGKPLLQAQGEVQKCAFVCEYYAQNIEKYLNPHGFSLEGFDAQVVFEPLGVIFGIMPWNYPYWQVFRYAVPALLSGNIVLLKHAPNLPQCAKAIEQLFIDAGFDKDVFQNLFIGHQQAEAIIKDKRVAAVTFTGSGSAGAKIGALAGAALKKSVLELGGSDPFIVLKDANLDKAAKFAVEARFNNAGQICIAAKRWIVEAPVAEAFLEKAKNYLATWKIGNPLEKETQLGPMARPDLKQQLTQQVQQSIEMGASVLYGKLNTNLHASNIFEPMILGNILPQMPAACEELFGPVASFYIAQNAEHAIEIANDTQYGLGAALWTEDRERAKILTTQIEAGTVAINGTVSSHPALPFGGIKQSGYGRELGLWGLQEFVNVKTITIR